MLQQLLLNSNEMQPGTVKHCPVSQLSAAPGQALFSTSIISMYSGLNGKKAKKQVLETLNSQCYLIHAASLKLTQIIYTKNT